ncbi:MAG: DUF72 domain-containing protein [Bryobacterales bacterium]|nr:DUF72 domain-containing protein [Bryobacterales bacterium]
MAQLFAGSSGFAYPNWKPDFYPQKLPAAKFLEHYATRLNAVEINYTFRRLPARSTLENWVSQVTPAFLFALKANMRITHVHRLKDAAAPTELFFKTIEPLRSARRLGPVLFQLPPQMRGDEALLASYLELLPRDIRCAFEFRHNSWLNDAVYRLLEKHNVSLCLAESEKLEVPKVITADFVYFRLRKPEYSEEDRKEIAREAGRLIADRKDVFVFFKHEDTAAGALYAEQLLRSQSRAAA